MKREKLREQKETTIFCRKLSFLSGALRGTRTPDLLLRRQLLYPAELSAHFGAGDGNRTHVTSLEGWNSTIELHLRVCDGVYFSIYTVVSQVKIKQIQKKFLYFLQLKS